MSSQHSVAARRVGSVLLGFAVLLAAWTAWLGATLPPSPISQDWSSTWLGLDNWQLTWVGLDSMEVMGLLATGLSLRRHGRLTAVPALLTLPVFVLDAWFDVMTSASRVELRTASLMALAAELPMAAVLAWVARREVGVLASCEQLPQR